MAPQTQPQASKPAPITISIPESKLYGQPVFGKLPNGPTKYERDGSLPSVAAFGVVVPIRNTPYSILATCYGRKDKQTGEIEFTITHPGLSSMRGKPTIAVDNDTRAHFQSHCQAHAGEWALYDMVTDQAMDVLLSVKAATSAAHGGMTRLVKKPRIEPTASAN